MKMLMSVDFRRKIWKVTTESFDQITMIVNDNETKS